MRRRLRTSTSSREGGAAAVEFAIVSGLLFTLIFGIIQFGIVFAQGLALGNAARQAARVGAVQDSGTCLDIITQARQGSTTLALDSADLNFSVTVGPGSMDLCPGDAMSPAGQALQPCVSGDPGDQLKVELAFVASISLPLVGGYTPPLAREGTYRCEFNVAVSPPPAP